MAAYHCGPASPKYRRDFDLAQCWLGRARYAGIINHGGYPRMSHTPHDLHAEFPEDGEVLHRLKLENAHFATLSDRYHEVNKQIHRSEAEVEPVSDEHAEELKKRRLHLLDEISTMVSAAKA
jgi:uncharacterized protein YdcH (DUF465 family)